MSSQTPTAGVNKAQMIEALNALEKRVNETAQQVDAQLSQNRVSTAQHFHSLLLDVQRVRSLLH